MDLTGITPHCFKHTFATAGIASGVDIVTMKDLLGHANSKMLIDTYAHANLGIKKDSVNKITESYGIIIRGKASFDKKIYEHMEYAEK